MSHDPQKFTVTSACVAFLLVVGFDCLLQSVSHILAPGVTQLVNYFGDFFSPHSLHWQESPIAWGLETGQILLSLVALAVAILIGRHLLGPRSDQENVTDNGSGN